MLSYSWPLLLQNLPMDKIRKNLNSVWEILSLKDKHVGIISFYCDRRPETYDLTYLQYVLEMRKVSQNKMNH